MVGSSDQQRWGSNTRKDNDGAVDGRDIILNAAIACYQKNGMAKTTIDDIAATAKISRRSVYRYFANKQQIIEAIVAEQASEFFKGLDKKVGKFAKDFPSLLKNCMLYAIEHGPKTPGHELLLGADNAMISSQHYFSSNSIDNHWKSLLREPFDGAVQAGVIAEDIEFDELVRWSGRIVFSFIQFPESRAVINKQIDRFLLRNLRG